MDEDKRVYLGEAIAEYEAAIAPGKGQHLAALIDEGGPVAALRVMSGFISLTSVLLVRLGRATDKSERDLLANIAARYASPAGTASGPHR